MRNSLRTCTCKLLHPETGLRLCMRSINAIYDTWRLITSPAPGGDGVMLTRVYVCFGCFLQVCG
jgi:hypothetical protein